MDNSVQKQSPAKRATNSQPHYKSYKASYTKPTSHHNTKKPHLYRKEQPYRKRIRRHYSSEEEELTVRKRRNYGKQRSVSPKRRKEREEEEADRHPKKKLSIELNGEKETPVVLAPEVIPEPVPE